MNKNSLRREPAPANGSTRHTPGGRPWEKFKSQDEDLKPWQRAKREQEEAAANSSEPDMDEAFMWAAARKRKAGADDLEVELAQARARARARTAQQQVSERRPWDRWRPVDYDPLDPSQKWKPVGYDPSQSRESRRWLLMQ